MINIMSLRRNAPPVPGREVPTEVQQAATKALADLQTVEVPDRAMLAIAHLRDAGRKLPKNSLASSIAGIGRDFRYQNRDSERWVLAVSQVALTALSGPTVPPMIELASQAAALCNSSWSKAQASFQFLNRSDPQGDEVVNRAAKAITTSQPLYFAAESIGVAYTGIVQWAQTLPEQRAEPTVELSQFAMQTMINLAGCHFEFSDIGPVSYASQIAQRILPQVTEGDELNGKLAAALTPQRSLGDVLNGAAISSKEFGADNIYPLAAARYGVISVCARPDARETSVQRVARAANSALGVLDSPTMKQRSIQPFLRVLAEQTEDATMAARARVLMEEAKSAGAVEQVAAGKELIRSILATISPTAPATTTAVVAPPPIVAPPDIVGPE